MQILSPIFHHHCCLHYDCYHGVTFKAGMCLTTYYLSLLWVHQVHAKQDTLNEGHHQWHHHHGHCCQAKNSYLLLPPLLSPVWLLPQCDPWSRDVHNNILPESLAWSPGASRTGCPKQRASSVASSSLSLLSGKAYLPLPPLPPIPLLPKCDPQSWDVPNNILPESIESSPGACRTGSHEQRASSLIAYLPSPPLFPLRLLPWCDPQSRDVPNNVLPEFLTSSLGACWTQCPEWRASSVSLSSCSSSSGKAYLLPPLSPVQLLPQCGPQSRDVPKDTLAESLASSPGTCQIGCHEQRASSVVTTLSSSKANLLAPPPPPSQ